MYIVLFALLSTMMSVPARERPRYLIGSLVSEPIVNRVDFNTEDRDRTLENRLLAESEVPLDYRIDHDFYQGLQAKLLGVLTFAEYDSLDSIPESSYENLAITPEALNELHRLRLEEDSLSRAWEDRVRTFLRRVFNEVILNRNDAERVLSGVEIRYHGIDRIERVDPEERIIYTRGADDPAIRSRLSHLSGDLFPDNLRLMIVSLIVDAPDSTYRFDAEMTQQSKQEAYSSPVHIALRVVPKGQVIVPAGRKLTENDLLLMEQEAVAYQEEFGNQYVWVSRFGVFTLTMVMGLGLWSYLFRYKHRVVENPMRGLAVAAMLVGCQALAVYATRLDPKLLMLTATLPTLMLTIVFAIAYDQRFALAVGAMHGVVILFCLNQPMELGLVIFTGVGIAAAMLREVRTLGKLVRVGLAVGLAMSAMSVAVDVVTEPLHLEHVWGEVRNNALFALMSGFGAGVIVLSALPVLEAVFKVTTAMTLKDLNDASHPLLQRLAQEAPGTYQHSLRIADMAEAAAEAIGADGLLCRVGAMYHDIGKVNKPSYFIENQSGGPNKHAKLSPAMSLLVIVGHVKDGIEMAREYKLPGGVKHFIESHHGTTLVEYFYHQAKQQNEAEDKPCPSEFEFRYPGPKPQTKEAAIMLLCDSLEAAARTIDEPTHTRLEQLVHTIAQKRLSDGQFDECSITLQELHRIEQAIIKTLNAIYHARIKYPSDKREEDAGESKDATAGTIKPAAAS